MMDAGIYILLLPEVIKQKCKSGIPSKNIEKSRAAFQLKRKMKSHRTFITPRIFAIH